MYTKKVRFKFKNNLFVGKVDIKEMPYTNRDRYNFKLLYKFLLTDNKSLKI